MSTFGDRRHTRRGSFGLLVRDLAPEPDDEDDRLILTAAHLLDGVPDGTRVAFGLPGPEPSSADGQHGAQTLETAGDLLPIQADHKMHDVKAGYAHGWWVYGADGTAFAGRGDSGAIVVDEARKVVGMLVAIEHDGPGSAAFVHGIKQVFSALEIELS